MKLNGLVRRLGLVALAATVGAVGVVSVAAPAGSAVVPASYSVTVTPTSTTASTQATYNVKFTNAGLPESVDVLNNASVTLANGFTAISAPSSVSDSLGLPWTVSVAGSKVTLSSLVGILPGSSVSVPITATSPPAAGIYPFATSAKGLINGATAGGDFVIVGVQPAVSVAAGAPSKLVFVQQPTFVQRATAMSPPVKVAVHDSAGNVVSSYSTPITLTAAFNPNTGNATNPSGLPASATPSNGIATFNNLKINDIGIGYKLRASSGNIAPATSNSFDVATVVGTCPANQQCDTGFIGDPKNTEARMIVQTGSANDVYRLTVGGYPDYACNAGPSSGKAVTFENNDLSRVLKIMMVLDKVKVHEDVDNGSAHYGICFESKQPFMTNSGTTSPLGPNGFYRGFLPSCAITGNAPPCLVGVTGSSGGDRTATLLSTPGDPRGMFGILAG